VPPAFARRFRGPPTSEQRVEQLVNAGFSPDRAAWIDKRSSELTMQAMQAQYAQRRGENVDSAQLRSPDQTLRSELGDADYERYLAAQGRPTKIGVYNVLASSPAERAGLQPGDQIVSYGGQRVFDMRDLNDLTLQGTPGQPIAIEVERDQQTVQLVIPRGPIGIGGGPGGAAFGRRP
jgi:S1-C subfamily serine protease